MINFAIVGYGNLGRACEKIAHDDKNFNLVGIFTRRDPATMKSPFGTAFYNQSDIENFKGKTLPTSVNVARNALIRLTVSTLTRE